MKTTPSKTFSVAGLLAGSLLLALPLRGAFSPREAQVAQTGDPSSTTATLSLDPQVGADLQVVLLLTEPMVEVTSQNTCRVVTTLAYCTVQDEPQDSIDLETSKPALTSSETLHSWVDYAAGGSEVSLEVSFTPKAGLYWGDVKGIGDVTIQTETL